MTEDHSQTGSDSEQSAAEILFRRYWFTLSRRCRKILGSASRGDEVARLSLARLLSEQPELDPQAEWLLPLWQESTTLCVSRLSDRAVRDTTWLKNMERAKKQKAEQSEQPEQPEQPAGDQDAIMVLGPILGRLKKKTRTLAIHHYLDRLSSREIVQLSKISESSQAKVLARLKSAAAQDLAGLEVARDCPSQLALDRLLAGETTGLEQAQKHLDDNPQCAKDQENRAEEQQAFLTAEAVGAGIEALALAQGRVDKAARQSTTPLGSSKVWAPAMVCALCIGLGLVLFWPSAPKKKPSIIDEHGGFYLEALVSGQGSQMEKYKPGDLLSLGDRVAFRAGANRPSFVAMARVGETGIVELVAANNMRAWPLPVRHVVDLPFRLTLGPSGKYERVFVMFCVSPAMLINLPDMLSYAYQANAQGRRDLRREWISAPENCDLRSVLLTRQKDIGEKIDPE